MHNKAYNTIFWQNYISPIYVMYVNLAYLQENQLMETRLIGISFFATFQKCASNSHEN